MCRYSIVRLIICSRFASQLQQMGKLIDPLLRRRVVVGYYKFRKFSEIIHVLSFLIPKVLWHFSSKNHSKLSILEH